MVTASMSEIVFLKQKDRWVLCDLLGYEGTRWAKVRLPIGAVRRVKRSRLHYPTRIDLTGPAARALRTIQKLDQLLPIETLVVHRSLLLEAETALGEVLGLECGGKDQGGGGFYDHSGDTCPIHEWLVPSDHDVAEAMR